MLAIAGFRRAAVLALSMACLLGGLSQWSVQNVTVAPKLSAARRRKSAGVWGIITGQTVSAAEPFAPPLLRGTT